MISQLITKQKGFIPVLKFTLGKIFSNFLQSRRTDINRKFKFIPFIAPTRAKVNSSTGFTLVEMLVAVSVFLVIVTISMGAVLTIIDANRKSQALKNVLTNLNFAMETISRDVKFGKNYSCTIALCSSGDSEIRFTSSSGLSMVYRLYTYPSGSTAIQQSVNGGTSFTDLTSPDVTIQSLKFYIFGYNTGDGIQPRVIIMIKGYSGNKPSIQSNFVLQTTVSQRVLDI